VSQHFLQFQTSDRKPRHPRQRVHPDRGRGRDRSGSELDASLPHVPQAGLQRRQQVSEMPNPGL